MKTIVKKYGGATLADPEKIKAVAKGLRLCYLRGEKLVVVVSAMGQTTNDLINLGHQISSRPKRREMDMLLSTGERISMALMSMALNDLSCPAISFTGSQAGVFTDDSHLNAFISDVKSPRVVAALQRGQIVIIAGFQGVSPNTKEVTTLGRGGSDTTAVAIASALNADHCEILKDVAGVFSADPKICKSAHPIKNLTYQQMLEMTFWGAKVLHYRSVELALNKNVSIYIGPAHSVAEGTWVRERNFEMFEAVKVLSVNSHAEVIKITLENTNLAGGLTNLQKECHEKEISFPQLIATETMTPTQELVFLTGSSEILQAIKREIPSLNISSDLFSSVTATCSGASTPEIAHLIAKQLAAINIFPLRIWMSGMSCTVLILASDKAKAISAIHELVALEVERR
jgi:aspartate kinase